jgi:peroxiredoxin
MILLKDLNTQQTLDTTFIVGNKFVFKGNLETPKRLFLMTKTENRKSIKYLSLWVENSEIYLHGNFKEFRYSRITGSSSQDTENILQEWTKKGNLERDSLTNLYFSLSKHKRDSLERQIWDRISVIDKENQQYNRKFIREYLNTYPALERLSMLKNEIPKDSLKIFFNKLDPKFKTTEEYKVLKIYIESKIAKEGDNFIDFSAKTIEGKDFHLSQLKGKYILLDFWSAGCGPCRKMNKALANKYETLKDKLELVSFSVDANQKYWKMATKQDNIQWTNVSDLKGNNGETYIKYGITGIPCSFLINPEGKIIKKSLGFSEDHLNKLLKIISQQTGKNN